MTIFNSFLCLPEGMAPLIQWHLLPASKRHLRRRQDAGTAGGLMVSDTVDGPDGCEILHHQTDGWNMLETL